MAESRKVTYYAIVSIRVIDYYKKEIKLYMT